MRPSNSLENKTPSYTYWRVQLVCKKVPANSSLEPPLEYNREYNKSIDLPLLRILLAIRQKSREPVLGKWWTLVLLAYASLAASRALLQRSLACLNFILDSEDLSFCYKRRKQFLWTMTAAQAAENHGDERGLTWYFRWEIYTSIPTWTHWV